MYNTICKTNRLALRYTVSLMEGVRAMPAATRTVSVRLPRLLVKEAADLSPETKMSEIIGQALKAWVAGRRRQHEDDLIRQALSSASSEQRQEERRLAEMAARSSLSALERLDG